MAVSAPGEAPGSVLAIGTLDQRTNAADLTTSSFSSGRTDTRAVAQGEALPKQPIDPEAAQLGYCLPAEAGHLANQTLLLRPLESTFLAYLYCSRLHTLLPCLAVYILCD